MSRIDELKKQHPIYAMSAIDLYKMMSPNQTNKYVEMLIKLDKNEPKYRDEHRSEIIACMVRWGLDYNYLETFDLEMLTFVFNSLNNLMSEYKIMSFTKFASLNERKLIENNDVTSYSSWGDIEQAISLAEIKLIDKETAKQIKKIYEDDEWLSLRPLSLEASMKYGANTKWCTTTNTGQYYARYSARVILIYNINKKTGYKVACFKNLDSNYDNEFSWWDVTDRRIEALDSEAPSAVLEAIRNEIKNTSVANKLLMTKAEADKLEIYKDGRSYDINAISNDRMYITGGLNDYPITGTTNTLVFNPSHYTTTGTVTTSSNTLTYNTGGNVGIGTINPTTQLSITGDMEIDGNIRFTSEGVERARLTPNGFQTTGTTSTQQYNHFEQPTEEQRDAFNEYTRRINGSNQAINEQVERRLFPNADRIAADAQQRLDDEMGAQLAAANERVAEKHLSLLDNIELGTLDNDMKIKMQMLAGIKTTKQQIQELEADIERLRSEEAQPEVVHLSLWNKIKNTGKKLSRTFTSRSRKQIGALPRSVSARLEAVKQSQEL
jgi:molecular chaperone GrpE (heat shock protein)